METKLDLKNENRLTNYTVVCRVFHYLIHKMIYEIGISSLN